MLPAQHRLRKKADHNRVFKKGRRSLCPFFVLLAVKREVDKDAPTRFSFVVSKKVDKRAPVRNRVRRVLRESVKTVLTEVKPGYDCIVIARNATIGKKVPDVSPTLREIFEKAGILSS